MHFYCILLHIIIYYYVCVHLFVVHTYVRTRIVHSHHPRVPVLKVWHFDVWIALSKTRALAQRASARQTRAWYHPPRTLSFCPRRPVGTDIVGGLWATVTHNRSLVVIDITICRMSLIHSICYNNKTNEPYYFKYIIFQIFRLSFKCRTLFAAAAHYIIWIISSIAQCRGKRGSPDINY